MFDYVKCEVSLPDGHQGDFQTKSFDNNMDTYTIKSNGILEMTSWRIEKIDGQEFPTFPEDADMWERIEGFRKVTKKVEETNPVDFHGVFEFYNTDSIYQAKFTDGKLNKITQVEVDANPDN